MIDDINGRTELTENEKATVLEGLRLMSVFCECNLGCGGCPFEVDPENKSAVRCYLKNSLPCCWDIPESWTRVY